MKMKSMLLGALALVCTCTFGKGTRELGVKGKAPGVTARKLRKCDFLLNKVFKKNAKYYLCLFSASWCPPCRAEMPRIARTYAETLKDDPDIELIHFSRDQNDEKALIWAKEHDVKFPVVKPNGGNPLDLHSRGIPHLFIVDAAGKLIEEGHPVKLFTDKKLSELKVADGDAGYKGKSTSGAGKTTDLKLPYEVVDGAVVLGEGTARSRLRGASKRKYAVVKITSGELVIPENIDGMPVRSIGSRAFADRKELMSVTIPSSVTSIGESAFRGCRGLSSVTIPDSVTSIGRSAFSYCSGLTVVTICGEHPDAPNNIFQRCGKLKTIKVPANAKSWAGMKKWHGIPLVFEESTETQESKAYALAESYGIRMQPDPGCEKGAEYVLKRLVEDYLPVAVRYYGNPFGGKSPSRVYTIVVKRNDGSDGRGYTGPSWGSRGDGVDKFTIGLARGSDKWDMDLTLVASKILTVCHDDVGFHLYVNDFIRGDARGIDPVPEIKEMIRKGLAKEGDENIDRRLRVWREYAPMWSVFEELRARHPNFMLGYCNLKNSRYAEGKLPQKLSFDQMVDLLGEATGENMAELLKKYGAGRRESRKYPLPKISVAQELQSCDFLLNKDFKKDAKYYLCLFSASWCGPCRREMPRIAKTYVESLKDDPNVELIHFSRDREEDKALAWAKEYDVKFPVVKYNGGNPLDLHTRGIPHLFIVEADGKLLEEGHPAKLFTNEKLNALKTGTFVKAETAAEKVVATWWDRPRMRPGVALVVEVGAIGMSPNTMNVTVDRNGSITLPHLFEKQPIYCDGLTLETLKLKLVRAYSRYYRQPMVEVSFAPYDGKGVSPWGAVTVLGEVGKTGPVNMPATMDLTVTKVLKSAGGCKPSADKTRIRVTRCDKDGNQTRTYVNINEIGKKNGRVDKDIPLRPGDVVWVPAK